ncbi:MAG TPA: MaoC family dehydratase N-terminal domain-containing protein [Actinomycetota bacterium]|nr:MaoC family dehydratase N-terminal domain-containing protein [Actinomycetota bacterium]
MNQAVEGKAYPPVRYEVTTEAVRAFAAAVGEDPDRVPPTFLTVPEMTALAQVVADPDLGIDFSRVVHGEQAYEWRRPVLPGDVLSAAPRIERIRSRGGHAFLTVETEIRDRAGEVVALARCTLIERGTG